MSTPAERVLQLFHDKLASEVPVRGFSPWAGVLEVLREHGWIRLHMATGELEALIPGASAVWGPGVSGEEGAARLMLVHLDESLDTRTSHETGWWTYTGGFFEPRPPWDAYDERRQGR